KKEITDIAAAAESLQPKGYTLATAQVKTPVPFLLRGSLREYQHIGLDWLVTMNEKMLNGILADEMGLGKTIQTIALLGHLACDRGNWGPHLVVVPTSVMLNWEMEFKRWFPAFKILTYYGVPKERKQKRQGWTRPNAFHVCITSYKLVLQDHQAFRRKKWKYLILDEAQNIKNFKSQRYTVRHQHRLLLTGTPLQNSLMELWSLMHFLMPHVFQSHREFREWFSNPLTGMIEGSQEYNESLVKRLHKVLRPFLLRRIKMDVEKQMPKKYEHIVRCRLSKRQRYLYDDFMSQATTRETLASGHFMSVINILMQLRKVCNHPNLFDPRPITSPFITQGICYTTASLVLTALEYDPWRHVDLSIFDLVNAENQLSRYEAEVFLPNRKVTRKLIEEISTAPDPPPRPKPVRMKVNRCSSALRNPPHTLRTSPPACHVGVLAEILFPGLVIDGTQRAPTVHLQGQPQIRPTTHFVTTQAVPAAVPLTRGPTTRSVDRKATAEEAPSKRKDSASAAEAPAPKKPAKRTEGAWRWSGYVHCRSVRQSCKPSHPDVYWSQTSTLQSLCINSEQRLRELKEIIESEKKLKSNEEVPPRLLRHARFIFVVPPVESPPISLHAPHPPPSMLQKEKALWQRLHEEMSPRSAGLHRILCNMRTQFPDLRLIQYDCGKLQTLDILLRKFKAGSHRVLIFTQMTRMLDVLEQFLNFHGYIYLRLDGTTRVEQRQFLMDRFNADARIFCFILSTRSGGVGVNLTGADTVVFYDSDWNPTMDAQAQDRCHRIGQTRDVHIYRLISERTVEENILKKANQKRMLGDVAIEGGNFTTAYFKQVLESSFALLPADCLVVWKLAKGGVRSACSLRAQALGKAEDEEDIRAASQARAEQVAELAEFNENAADDGEEGGVGGEGRDEEEPSKAEEEINALVQQLTPIERYALKYLEASIAAETEE
uniref:Snf2-related CREBBP activator protein n=1 Tax=Petromyzon marinus TaxID=7757 RepID=S4R6S0_PETMA